MASGIFRSDRFFVLLVGQLFVADISLTTDFHFISARCIVSEFPILLAEQWDIRASKTGARIDSRILPFVGFSDFRRVRTRPSLLGYHRVFLCIN